ncbi:MAG: hypothetical protein NTX03_12050 [Bacteroidetes bacterium]|nr:hypothetical protein [Bacteroidota bacterium]
MKQFYSKGSLRTSIVAMMLLLLTTVSSYASFTPGNTYTINPSAAASSTNYLTFASAQSDLVSGTRADGGTANGPGISTSTTGNVTFSISDGTYTEQISFNNITGTSATRRVIFTSASADSTKVTLTAASQFSSTTNYTVRLNGADWVTFQKMTIKRTGTSTYANVVVITNGSNNTIIENCRISGRYQASVNPGQLYEDNGCIYSQTYAGMTDDTGTIIRNNRIRFGLNGICMGGTNQTTGEAGLQIYNNDIDSAGQIGVLLVYCKRVKIYNNRINFPNHTAATPQITMAMRVQNSDNLNIYNNNITLNSNGPTPNAFQLWSSNYGNIYNNWISVWGGSSAAIAQYFTSNTYMNYYYNNVVCNSTISVGTAFYVSGAGTHQKLINNNFVNSGGALVYRINSTGEFDSSNYNNHYGANSTNAYYYVGGTVYSTFAAWKSASSMDANSKNVNPVFTSSTDLHVNNAILNGAGRVRPGITTDYDGDARNTSTPDIGADEFSPPALDGGVTSVDAPLAGSFCAPSTQSVKVTIVNNGTTTLTSADVKWTVNGSSQTTYNWTGSLATGATAQVTLGSYSFTSGSLIYTVKAWTESPNAGTDGNANNDTNSYNVKSKMSGTFTIGGTSPNYASFSAAVADLTAYGVCGAVTFNVADGIYNEQLMLLPITGASSTNTITFQSTSGDSSKVSLQFPSLSGNSFNNYVINFQGGDWFTFKKMGIKRSGSALTYGALILMIGQANNNTITNCMLIGPKIGSTASGNEIVDCGYDPISGSTTGTDCNFNTVSNNYVKYGSTVFWFYTGGSGYQTGNVISGNIVDSGSYMGVYAYYSRRIKILNNTFTNHGYSNTSAYGLYTYYADSGIWIKGNRFTAVNMNGFTYGMYTYLANANSTGYENIIVNNMISVPGHTTTYYLEYLYCTGPTIIAYNNYHIYANTTISGGGTARYGLYVANGTASYPIVKNNNFTADQANTVYYVASTSYMGSGNSNYNNFWNNATTNLIYFGATYNTLTAYKFGASMDLNSVSVNPNYYAKDNLHVNATGINNKGTSSMNTWVSTLDIDGQARSSTTPDIGADEFTPVAQDASITAITAPGTTYCPGSTSVTATLKNLGTSSLTSVTLNWYVNASVQAPYVWTGTLASNASTNIVVGSYSFTSGTYAVDVATTNPNGTTDGNTSNDSVHKGSINQGILGTYTVGGVSPNYATITAALTYISGYGICGTTTLNIRDGVYAEQMIIPVIGGTSLTNRLIIKSESNDSTKVTFTWPSSAASTYNPVLHFNGADFVTVKKMTFTSSGTNPYGQGVYFSNQANWDSIANCNVSGPQYIGTNTYSAAFYSPANDYCNNNTLAYNSFKYGSYNYFYGNSTTRPTGNKFMYNNIDSTYYIALYFLYHNNIRVVGNKIRYPGYNYSSGGNYGLYLLYNDSGLRVQNNFIYTPLVSNTYSYYAIYLGYSVNPSNNPGIVSNNWVSTVSASTISYGSALYMVGNSYVNVVYNSFLSWGANNTSGTGSGTYYHNSSGGGNNQFLNNICANTGGGYAVYEAIPGYWDRWNYNNLYTNGSNLTYWNGTNYTTLAAHKSGSGVDSNSVSVNPNFYGVTDLHTNSAGVNNLGKALAYVTTDYDGQTRSASTPDIGSDEFTPTNSDASINSIVSPATSYCAGTQNVNVALKNVGAFTLTSVSIKWYVNGTAQTPYVWTGTMTSGNSTTVTVGTYSFTSGTYVVAASSELPNGNPDNNTANDSAYTPTLNMGISGTLTVGPSGTYSTINAAMLDLKTNGICGNVVISVQDGVYAEQLDFDATYATSASNTITVQSASGDSSKCWIKWVASNVATNNFAIRFSGAKYITIKKMGISRTGASTDPYFYTLVMQGGSTYCKVNNCHIIGNTNYSNYTIYYYQNGTGLGNEITNTRIRYGYGMYLYGNTGSYEKYWTLTGNIWDSTYYGMGLYYYLDAPNISYNTVNGGANASNSTYYGAYLYYMQNSVGDYVGKFVGNKIICGPTAYYGIYESYSQSATKNIYLTLIANNMVICPSTNSAMNYLWYSYYNNNRRYYHNSLNNLGTYASCYTWYVYENATNSNIFTNNITSVTGNTANYGIGYFYYIGGSNYNDFYTNSSNFAYYNGTLYSTFAAWKTATSFDANSLAKDPGFLGATDLHASSPYINNAGTPLSAVTTDFDKQTRSTTFPDMGADEFTIPNTDAGLVSIDSPYTTSYCPGVHNVKATMKNFGLNGLSSATIKWWVDGVAQTDYSWTGSAVSNGSTVAINFGTYNFPGTGTHSVMCKVTNPNGTTDGNSANDSLAKTGMNPAMTGTKTIGGSSPDYATFAAALVDLNLKGVCGSGITYNVRDGIYNEQLNFTTINGASPTCWVTFQSQSNDSSKAWLKWPTSTSSTATTHGIVNFNGSASYIKFSKLGMLRYGTGTGDYYSAMVSFGSQSVSNITVTNCYMANTNVATPYFYYGAVDGYYWISGIGNNIQVTNNVIKGRFYYGGVAIYGYNTWPTGINVSGNTIDSSYYYGTFIYYCNSVKYERNTLNLLYHGSAGYPYYGAYLYYIGNSVSDGATSVSYNKIIMDNTSTGTNYGIFFAYGYNGYTTGLINTKLSYVNNNIISMKNSSTGSNYGLYTYYNGKTIYYHNSINLYGGTSGVLYGWYWYPYTTGVGYSMRNNSIVTLGTSTCYIIYWPNASVTYGNSRCNNYYPMTGGSSYAYNGTTYNTIASYNTAIPSDSGSISVNPNYFSNTDLHTLSSSLNNAGNGSNGTWKASTYVTTDMDGATRNATTPDIGADEFTPPTDDAGATAITNPAGAYCIGTSTNVTITLKNQGTNSLSSTTVKWWVDGTAQTDYSWTGTLTAGSSTSIVIGTYTFSTGGSHTINAKTTLPNGTTDGYAANDSSGLVLSGNSLSAGTYTIGGTTPDYATFTLALAALTTKGICGAVTFNVRDGIYTEKLNVTAISGVSATNTVTFQSQSLDSTKAWLNWPANNTASTEYAIVFNGCQYVTIKKLGIKRTGSTTDYYSNGVNFTAGAVNNTLTNCHMISNINYPASSMMYSTANGQGNTVTNNRVRYAGYALRVDGTSTVYETNWNISGNIIDTCYYAGIFVTYLDAPKINSNTINGCTHAWPSGTWTQTFGISLSYVRNSQSAVVGEVKGNKIIMPSIPGTVTSYALYDVNSYSATSNNYPTVIANNMISTFSSSASYGQHGMYISSMSRRYVYYNSSNVGGSLTNSTAAPYGVYFLPGTTGIMNDFKNNCIVNTTGGYAVYMYYHNTSGTSRGGWNYNNYYAPNSTYWVYNGSTYTTFALWKAGSLSDSNSINVNPAFNSATDLHTASANLNAAGTIAQLPLITTDFDGQTRNATTPDIGADEYTPPTNDAAVTVITSPGVAYCTASATNVTATIVNNAATTLTTAVVKWWIDGTAQTNYSWSGSLTAGSSTSVTVGSYTFTTTPTTHTVDVKVTSPNGGTDNVLTNDSLRKGPLVQGIQGTKTIDGGGAGDYISFTAAVTDMQTYGLCGAITFNVTPGYYIEQVNLQNIGSSATNTVLFQGSTSDSTASVLYFSANATASPNYLVNFNGVSYVTFKKLCFQRLSTTAQTYGNIFTYVGGANNITVTNCHVVGNKNYQTTGTTSNSFYSTANGGANNKILNNRIRYQFLYIYGTGSNSPDIGWQISGNMIDSTYYYGMLMAYHDGFKIQNNRITGATVSSSPANPLNYGIYLQYYRNTQSVSANQITGNRIYIPYYNTTCYGMYCIYSGTSYVTTNTYPTLIANNQVSIGYASASAVTGMYIYLGQRQLVYHNSINLFAGTGTSYGLYVYGQNTSQTTNNFYVRNNIVANKQTGASEYNIYNYYTYSRTNCFYSTGSTNNYFVNNGTTYSTLALYKAGTGSPDSSSVNGSNPNFFGNNDLHTTASISSNAGTGNGTYGKDNTGTTVNSLVGTDLDGETRTAATPDIGADEYSIPVNDIGVAITSPTTSYCSGSTSNVTATISNIGTNSLTSGTVKYYIDGVAQTNYIWSGTLATNATTSVVIGTYTLTTGSHVLQAKGKSPNGTTDDYSTNDSTYTGSMTAALGGTKTIGGTTPDYTTFTLAVADLLSKGVCSTLIFSVRDGVYSEAITLTAIPGASATNTVTFQSQSLDSSKAWLSQPASTSLSSIVILTNVSYVRFNKLGFIRPGTSSQYFQNCIYFNGVNGLGVQITNCLLVGNKANTSVTSSYTGNYSQMIASYVSTSSNNNGAFINNNKLRYGPITIYNAGYSTTTISEGNWIITNNIIDSPMYYGIYAFGLDTFKINGNRLNFANGLPYTVYGMYIYYPKNTTNATYGRNNELKGNKLYWPGYYTTEYGMYYYYGYSQTNNRPTIIANNMITISAGTGTGYGCYMYYDSKIHFYHNTINTVAGGTGSYSFYYYNPSPTSNTTYPAYVRNNIFNNVAGVTYMMYMYGRPVSIDYNNYYYTGANLGYDAYNGYAYSTFALWKAAVSGTYFQRPDSNGTNNLPQFVSNSDLHNSASSLNNTGGIYSGGVASIWNAYANTDYDGTTRSATTPDVGADEFTPPAEDVKMMSADTPGNSYCASATPRNVWITIKNNGTNNLTTATIKWWVNGTAQADYNWTGTITPGANSQLNIGSYVFNSGTYSMNFKSVTPNGGTDGNILDDSMAKPSIVPGGGGTYTIDAAGGGNYTTFSAAVSDLLTNGLCTPATYNVVNGVYNEQVNITAISGANATNTILFQSVSNDSSKVFITFNGNTAVAASNYALNFNGCSYVTFKGISVQRVGTSAQTSSNVVQFTNNAKSNVFRNGMIVANRNAYASSIAVYGNLSYYGNTVMNSRIRYGRGLYILGNSAVYETNWVLTGNILDSSYSTSTSYGAIHLSYLDAPTVSNNTINGSTLYGGTGTGILMNYVRNNQSNYAGTITRNTMTLINGNYGIYDANSYNATNNNFPTLVANNIINIQGAGVAYGIFSTASKLREWYYNTVNMTNTNTSSYALYETYNTSTVRNMQWKNNIFANSGGGQAAFVHLPQGMNYNDYYTTNSTFGSYNGTAYATFALWKTGSTKDSNSLNVNPQFYSSSNGHVYNQSINGAATPIASIVSNDVDGQTRNATTPDMGGDEFDPPAQDATILAITNPNPGYYCAGTNTVTATIGNLGYNALTSMSVNWWINGIAQTPYAWTGTLSASATTSMSIGTYNFLSGNVYYIDMKVVSVLPSPDGNPTNDSMHQNLYSEGLNAGTYTINPSNPVSSTNYQTFTAVAYDLNNRGLCGAVVFNASDGVYTGQISLGAITGSSATNTVTFNGNTSDSNKVIMSFPAGSTYSAAGANVNYVVGFNGCQYVTFNKMTMRRTSTGTDYFATLVYFGGGSHNNTVSNCVIKGLYNNAYYSYDHVLISDGYTYYNTQNIVADTNNTIKNNLMRYGTYPFYIAGNSSSIATYESFGSITGNDIDSAYQYNYPYIAYTNRTKFNTNKLVWRSGSSYGVYAVSNANLQLNGNTLFDTLVSPSYGFYVTSNVSVSLNSNTITNASGYTNNNPIYFASNNGTMTANGNTLRQRSTGTYPFYFTSNTSTNTGTLSINSNTYILNGTTSYPFYIASNTCPITMNGNTITQASTATTSSYFWYYYNNTGSTNLIQSNTISHNATGASYILYTQSNTGLTVRKNTITSSASHSYSVYATSNNAMTFDTNTITTSAAATYLAYFPTLQDLAFNGNILTNGFTQTGVAYLNTLTTSTRSISIQGNKFLNTSASSGSYIVNAGAITGSSTYVALIANNMFIAATATALSSFYHPSSASSYINFYHNTVRGSTTSTTVGSATTPMFFYTSTTSSNINVKNNIFANMSSGYVYYRYNMATSDYNDVYANNSASYNMAVNGTGYATLAAAKTAGYETNSVSVNPQFTSASDLHISTSTTPCAIHHKGVSGLGVAYDYDAGVRNTNPDLGADEFTVASGNGGQWTGSINTNWFTTGNWCDDVVPTSSTNVTVPSGLVSYPNIDTGTAVCNNYTINSSASTTVSGSTANLQISGSFTVSGTWSHTAGTTEFVSSSAQTIPSTTFWNLKTNGSSTKSLGGAVTVNNQLNLVSGSTLSIGANTLTMASGSGFKGTGTLTGSSSSNMTFTGSGSATIPDVSLNNLTINRSGSTVTTGDITVSGTQTMTAGTLAIGSGKTLTLNGAISGTGASLTGGTTSNLTVDGSGASTTVPAISGGLGNFTINRANGITLGGAITVNNTLALTNGTVSTAGNLSMAANTFVTRSSGSLSGTPTLGSGISYTYGATLTTGTELASTANNFTISTGTTTLGSNLTLNGAFANNGTGFIFNSKKLVLKQGYSGAGTLTGGGTSMLEVLDGGSATMMTIPSVTLADLTINRATGFNISGNITVTDSVGMVNGIFFTDTTNSRKLILSGATARLNETATSYVYGTVEQSKTIPLSTATNFGNMLSIKAVTTSPGTTVVTRKDQVITGLLSYNNKPVKGMNTTWDIVPTTNTNLGATVTFKYTDALLKNIVESSLDVYVNHGAGWDLMGTVSRNSTTNTIVSRATSHFSNFTLGGSFSNPLPVELISFTASLKNEVTAALVWNTASEIDNNHFDVERSIDGVTYVKVGEVAGHGTTNTENSYSYDDQFGNVVAPVLYYRLKQVDNNGTSTYSPVAKVRTTERVDGLKVWYNKESDKLSSIISVNTSDIITVKVTDQNGKVVGETKTQVNKGNNTLEIDMNGTAKGIYYFNYTSGAGTQVKSVMKY